MEPAARFHCRAVPLTPRLRHILLNQLQMCAGVRRRRPSRLVERLANSWTTDRSSPKLPLTDCFDSYRPMNASHLADLNPEQRRAAEYGSPAYTEAGPLLIIAGAGSGKTNTLAHRVAHLITNGIDPGRLLLLTFSRRAAVEMTRRVERIAANCIGSNASVMKETLTWSGTFHAIGARLLREYSAQIGLDRSFTIHDRADSEDLLNLIRHDLGFSNTEKRFPAKGTCLAIYSRVVNAKVSLEDVLGSVFPLSSSC
jgi:DNA helicase-2/ATP-dependent DNA helicase PcrA